MALGHLLLMLLGQKSDIRVHRAVGAGLGNVICGCKTGRTDLVGTSGLQLLEVSKNAPFGLQTSQSLFLLLTIRRQLVDLRGVLCC